MPRLPLPLMWTLECIVWSALPPPLSCQAPHVVLENVLSFSSNFLISYEGRTSLNPRLLLFDKNPLLL